MDVHKFSRKLSMKRFFLSKPAIASTNINTDVEIQHSNLSNASLFNPPGGMAPNIKVFRDVLLRDLEKIDVRKTKLNKSLQAGFDQLCEEKSIVIRPADKGGGIVILNKSDYLEVLGNIVGDRIPIYHSPRTPDHHIGKY